MFAHSNDVEVVHIDFGGTPAGSKWDTHTDQGNFDGQMFDMMHTMAEALRAFYFDMETRGIPICLLAVTEFGRTLDENDNAGTDHGRGGVALVMGQSVNGGRVVTKWPGLDDASLDPPVEGGDLAATIDLRDLMTEIGVDLYGLEEDALFPESGYSYDDQGII